MNITTRRFPRTLQDAFPCDAQSAIALHIHKQPLSKRFFYALTRWGWVAVLGAVFLLTGCDDLQTAQNAALDRVDAVHQANLDAHAEEKLAHMPRAVFADAVAQAAKEAAQ